MYVKPGPRPNNRRSISVPQNYSGNAFSSQPPELQAETRSEEDSLVNEIVPEESSEEQAETENASACEAVAEQDKKVWKNLGESDDLIILGLILLLSQDGIGDDILPLLLLLLFFKK